MTRSSWKIFLLGRIGFINQGSAGLNRAEQSREEFALQKEEDNDQIVLFPAKLVHGIQIANVSGNGTRHSCPLRILLSLPNADFGNIEQLHAPAALRQPDRMTAYTSCDIQGKPGSCAKKELLVSAHQKRIRFE